MSKYLKWYNSLCETRKGEQRVKGSGVYYELHHIKPRWMGGSDDSDNLVLLTGREHYIAHYLLFKHYKDKSSSAAFHRMNISCNMEYRDSKKYEEVRLWQSENLKGDNNPSKRLDVRRKISDKVSGKNNGMYGKTGSLNPFFGKTHSSEFLDYKRKLHGFPLIFNGIKYDSIRQAEKESGISRYKIKKQCKFL